MVNGQAVKTGIVDEGGTSVANAGHILISYAENWKALESIQKQMKRSMVKGGGRSRLIEIDCCFERVEDLAVSLEKALPSRLFRAAQFHISYIYKRQRQQSVRWARQKS
jgi:hypothetical protein